VKQRLFDCFPDVKPRVYYDNTNPSFEKVVKEWLSTGDLVLATNLAGRGTDFQTEPDLEANGGLHVLITFLPQNARIHWQNYGRAARQGKAVSHRSLV
jgi:preprotein translocase subunit SecA